MGSLTPEPTVYSIAERKLEIDCDDITTRREHSK
jgi:hypothetical protein